MANYPRVACRSGHKISKSFSASVLAWWWVHAHPRGRVVMTATTNPQIRNILWREIKAMRRLSPLPLPKPAELPSIGVQFPDGREIIGFSTDDAEKMAGISGAELLFIVDEASGVTEEIWEAIEGNRAGGAHVLAIGNPTQPAGTFYDAFHSKSSFWHTLHVSSIEASKSNIRGLATPQWCEEKLREWGPNSPLYQVRVLGEFADSGEDTVVPLAWVTRAQDLWHDEPVTTRRLHIGVDPARFGDDETTIAIRRGNKILSVHCYTALDTQQVAAKTLEHLDRYAAPGEPQVPIVKVDTIGIGAGVADTLRMVEGIEVVDVNSSETAVRDEEYFNLRTELWFNITDWLKGGGTLPPDDKLAADLLAPTYTFDNKNRLRVEKKDDIKKRLKRSPDRADAVALAIHNPRAALAYMPVQQTTNHVHPGMNYRLSGRGF